MALHDDELEIDEGLVRRLVARDAPGLADQSVHRLSASGSSNALFRLGHGALVRVPRQPGGSESIESEARWLPTLRDPLPVAVPELIVVGEPGFGYPGRWSITGWLDGQHPAVPETTAGALAVDLARFVREVRGLAVPAEALADPRLRSYRAGPLDAVDAEIRDYLGRCRTLPDLDVDLDACEQVWTEAVALPPSSDTSVHWVHGDLLAENLLVRGGRLAAVLDFGALAVGDPTVDLVVAWEVFTPADRDTFRRALDVNDTTWLRGRAWALAIALMTFPYYWRTMPGRCAARLTMAQAVVADWNDRRR